MSDGSPPPTETAGADVVDRPWYRSWWAVAALGLVAVVVVVAALVGGDRDPSDQEVAASRSDDPAPTGTPTPGATTTPDQPTAEDTAPDPEPTPTAVTPTGTDEPTSTAPPDPGQTATDQGEPAPVPVFGDGDQVVGEDVRPGTYRSDGATAACYWERVAGTSGDFEEIAANGNLSPEIVTIDEADTGFTSQGCGDWFTVEDTYPAVPATAFEDGTFAVGEHIEPGAYQAEGGTDQCYWERRSGFSGEFGDIVANGSTATTVEIDSSDAGFTSSGCGRWSRVG